MAVECKSVFTGEGCSVYEWRDVSSGQEGEPLKCYAYVPAVVQASGQFTKAYIEGSCDGVSWETIVPVSLPGMKKIDLAPLYVRPRVDGGSASFQIVTRR